MELNFLFSLYICIICPFLLSLILKRYTKRLVCSDVKLRIVGVSCGSTPQTDFASFFFALSYLGIICRRKEKVSHTYGGER
jgi:hypothetical protein